MTSPPALWRDPAFARLWAAQTVSAFGARITREGLPILAVTTLAASPQMLGVLAATANGAALVVGLALGGFVDRTAHRPVMMAADLVRAGVLITVPIAAALGGLTLVQVLAVAALVSASSVLFDMASHAYLPGLIGQDRLLDGNGRLATTESLAEIGGPALAGVLFQVLSAPFALVVNAATYLASAGFLGAIRRPEVPVPPPPAEPWLTEITAGVRLAWGEVRVRALFLMNLTQGLFGGVFSALYMLFALRTLNLPTSVLGLAIATGGLGALAGAWLGPWLAKRMGLGPAVLLSLTGGSLSALCIPLAPADRLGATVVLVMTQISGDALGVAGFMLMTTLRQTLLPAAVLGRVGGAFHAGAGGMAILGALGGGALGAATGPRLALGLAGAGFLLVPLIGVLSPLRRVRTFADG